MTEKRDESGHGLARKALAEVRAMRGGSGWSYPWIGIFLSLACDPRVCADAAERVHALPDRLSQTGLFAAGGTEQLATGVFEYEPEYTLWSDGADKRRWIFVPEGERIDTSDPDDWRFPIGTKLWKEFSRAGVRIETRLLLKTGSGDGDWAAAAYLWRPDRSDARLVPYGAVDALGTSHDVPATGECFACHAGRSSGVLGFSAIQLAPRSYESRERLAATAAEAVLGAPLTLRDVPGTAVQRAALGYLHANCSHCHNQSPAAKSAKKCLNPNQELDFDLDFSLHAGELADVEQTATYRTAIGEVVKRGDADGSKLVQLMAGRGAFKQMPPLGTERVDREGLATIRSWIGNL